MDLLSALPEDIFNEVISYLNVKDLRKASLVCKGWYQMFGQSNKCMQKFTATFNSRNYNNDLNPLLNSSRQYQNLYIEFYHKHIKEIGVEPKIRAILKKFAKSLIKLQTTNDFQRICELPQLKELIYRSCESRRDGISFSYFYSNGLIATCLNLIKLEVSCRNLDRKPIAILQEALKNMQNLKDLEICQDSYLKNLKPSDCKFRLESFNIGSSRMSNIYDFMIHHRSTLKVIKASRLSLDDLKLLFTQFPKLHTLEINHFNIFGTENGTSDLSENSTVKNFYLKGYIYPAQSNDELIEIVPKLKNLKQLYLNKINPELLTVLFASNSLALVKYRKLDNGVTEEHRNYMNNNENIKFIHSPYLN